MDVIEALQRDHRQLADQLHILANVRSEALRHALVARLRTDLQAHLHVAAQLFDGTLQGAAALTMVRSVDAELLRLLDELAALANSPEAWAASLGALRAAVERHAREEEGHLLAAARRRLSREQAERLGDRWREERQLRKALVASRDSAGRDEARRDAAARDSVGRDAPARDMAADAP